MENDQHQSSSVNSARTNGLDPNSGRLLSFSGVLGKPIEEFLNNYEPVQREISGNGTVSLEPLLGRGSFGSVSLYRPKYKKLFKLAGGELDPEMMAVKKFFFDAETRERQGVNITDIRREAEILIGRRTKYMVKGYEFYEGPSTFYLVMEYVTGGTLFEALAQLESESFSENDARTIIRHLLWGLQYCHGKGLYHRDIKPENILLRKKLPKQVKREIQPPQGTMSTFKMLNERFEIVLADFGFATTDPSARPAGTIEYMAPEIRRIFYAPPWGAKGKEFPYEKADIWSLGVVAYSILSGGYYLFAGSAFSREALRNEVDNFSLDQANLMSSHHLSRVSKHGKEFLECMLNEDYKKRYDVAHLLTHDWFQLPEKNMQNTLNLEKFPETHLQMIAARERRILSNHEELELRVRARAGEGESTEFSVNQIEEQLLYTELELIADSSSFISRFEHFDPNQGNPNETENL